MDLSYDVVIVGGGIIGLSCAMQLLQRNPGLKVLLLEKESGVARHQTGHNSGVIHAGVYYPPGSLKAKFCVAGCQQTKAFCDEHAIPYKVPGKLIVATNELELSRMQDLMRRCQQNGLTVEALTAKECIAHQPGLNAVGGFWVRETGIVDWKQVAARYAECFLALGGEIRYDTAVVAIKELADGVRVTTAAGDVLSAGYLLTCAGLYADKMVKLSGLTPTFKIIPFRGEYYRLSAKYDGYFKHLIYPVPEPGLPFLGVHFTEQMAGFTTIGPSAVMALSREGYRWGAIKPKELFEILSFSGIWKMIFKYFNHTVDELRGSLFTGHYLKHVQRYMPEITRQDLLPYPAGVRAQAMSLQGELISDFLFMSSKRTLHVCNAPSPAATSGLPIGQHVIEQLMAQML